MIELQEKKDDKKNIIFDESNSYYDAILFAAELAPKNDFTLQYENGRINFQKLSTQSMRYFLNRFKNFDLIPSRAFAFKGRLYNIELSLSSIYENFTNKLKTERAINRCTSLTLRILNCLEFVLINLAEIEYSMVIKEDCFQLAGITSESLSLVVEQMRKLHLKSHKIIFSSKSQFQIIFNFDEILPLIESKNSFDYSKSAEPFTNINDSEFSKFSIKEYTNATNFQDQSLATNICLKRGKRKNAKKNNGLIFTSKSLDDIGIENQFSSNNATIQLSSEDYGAKQIREKVIKTKSSKKCSKSQPSQKNLTTLMPFSNLMNTTNICTESIATTSSHSQKNNLDESIDSVVRQDYVQCAFKNLKDVPILINSVQGDSIFFPDKPENDRLIFTTNPSSELIYKSWNIPL